MTTPVELTAEAIALTEQLAKFMCAEMHVVEPYEGHHWPEHENDDGYRGNRSYVTLHPSDILAKCRENAARVLAFLKSRNLTGLGGDGTAWLIEAEGPKWFSAGKNSYHWTKDASEALRFARKEDAERFGEWCTISFFMDCKATEHMWPAPSLTVHVPGLGSDADRNLDCAAARQHAPEGEAGQ